MPRFPTMRASVTRLLFWFGVALLVGPLSGRSLAFDGEKYLPEAKVSLAQARQIALKIYPGKIVSEELEKESGGSGLRYSLVIIGSKMRSMRSASTRRPGPY